MPDTNIVIELFKGNQTVITLLEKQEKVYLPTAALGKKMFTKNSLDSTKYIFNEYGIDLIKLNE